MKVTGAREPLKKAHRGGRHPFSNLEDGMSIFDILEMFRDGHGIEAENGGDPFQQILMAAANAEGENNEGVSDEDREDPNIERARVNQHLIGDSDEEDFEFRHLHGMSRPNNTNPIQMNQRNTTNNEMVEQRHSNTNSRDNRNENNVIEHSQGNVRIRVQMNQPNSDTNSNAISNPNPSVNIGPRPRNLFVRQPDNYGFVQTSSNTNSSGQQRTTYTYVYNPSRRDQQPNRTREIKADKSKIKNLMEMGFTKSMCKAALKRNNNNMDKALDKLLENSDRYIGVENSESSEDGGDEVINPADLEELREEVGRG